MKKGIITGQFNSSLIRSFKGRMMNKHRLGRKGIVLSSGEGRSREKGDLEIDIEEWDCSISVCVLDKFSSIILHFFVL